jgi:hypothetical protein
MLTEVVFLQVPLPRSGDVVKYLAGIPQVESAAAVYSGVDVIAVLDGAQNGLSAAHARFDSREAPIAAFECFVADRVIKGASGHTSALGTQAACGAFIRCAIGTPDVSVPYASAVLSKLAGVVRAFPSEAEQEIVLEIVADDKRTLDYTIMTTIQGQAGIVTSTRSYITINAMQWRRRDDSTRSG